MNQLTNFISNMTNTGMTASNDILHYINLPQIRQDEKMANYMTMLKSFKTMISDQFNVLYSNVNDSMYSEISYELCSSTFLKILTFMFGHGGILYYRIFNNHSEFAYPKTDMDEYGATNLIIIWRDYFTFKWNSFCNNNKDAFRYFLDFQYILDSTYQILSNAIVQSDVDRLDVYNQAINASKDTCRSMFIKNINKNTFNRSLTESEYADIYNELQNSDIIAILTDYAINRSFINISDFLPYTAHFIINNSYIYYLIKDFIYYNIVALFEMLFTCVDNYQYIETSIICQGIRTISDKIGGNI